MGDNLIPYWEAWLQDEIEIPMNKDGYVINYSIINMVSSEGVGEWLCCNTLKKVCSFIKFVLLPSVIITKVIGKNENQVYLDVSNYQETIDMLEECEFDGYKEAIEEYTSCFQELEMLEKHNASWQDIKKLLDYINYSIDIQEGILVNLQLYENISSVGKTLIREYEEQGMLAELEDIMELKKKEIEELFDNIDNNEFMMKKISILLNSKVLL
ncbi:hypothetical protein KQI77_02935 [Clostridium sp. MSJ-8]|uniref:hypothetical protein n=1 Tax=Clostridium sp. MSJ-8 TaxID=2841510 RepID=UPI001C0F288E|nr:hypothetical protein [Clostridium sp. MSJ-8]MBU5487118.1 hypothetical protein [Clostridium sp. MSJ-8]